MSKKAVYNQGCKTEYSVDVDDADVEAILTVLKGNTYQKLWYDLLIVSEAMTLRPELAVGGPLWAALLYAGQAGLVVDSETFPRYSRLASEVAAEQAQEQLPEEREAPPRLTNPAQLGLFDS